MQFHDQTVKSRETSETQSSNGLRISTCCAHAKETTGYSERAGSKKVIWVDKVPINPAGRCPNKEVFLD